MAVNKVDLYVSQIKELLDEGYTWLEKDNLGYGSIEKKHGATPLQIATIRKHPKLKDLETNITIFNVIDDTKNDSTTNTKETPLNRSDDSMEREVVSMANTRTDMVSNDAANIFAQL